MSCFIGDVGHIIMGITTCKVAILVGSLRKGSFSRQTAKALVALAPAGFQFDIVGIDQLPLYDQDYDDAPPAEWVSFREKIRAPTLFCSLRWNTIDPYLGY